MSSGINFSFFSKNPHGSPPSFNPRVFTNCTFPFASTLAYNARSVQDGPFRI